MTVIRGSHGNIMHDIGSAATVSLDANPTPNFDWYRATAHGYSPGNIIRDLSAAFPLASVKQSGGRFGYDRGAQLVAGEKILSQVWWSTSGTNSGVCVDTPSENSATARDALQPFEHRVTRADVCLDYCEDGLFEYMAAVLTKFAILNDLKIEQMGDWERGKARTLYIGSRSSTAFLRLYEKGQKEGGNPFWIRLEFEFKPKGKAGYNCAKYQPAEFLGSCRWVRKVLGKLGIDYLALGQSIGTIRKPQDSARAKLALLRQYGKIASSWMHEHDDNGPFIQEWNTAMDMLKKHENTGDISVYMDLIDLLEGNPEGIIKRKKQQGKKLTKKSAFSEIFLEKVES